MEIAPDWVILCDPEPCPVGSYKKNDCSCAQVGEDPYNACPGNTRCQTYPELMCISCDCGFVIVMLYHVVNCKFIFLQ